MRLRLCFVTSARRSCCAEETRSFHARCDTSRASSAVASLRCCCSACTASAHRTTARLSSVLRHPRIKCCMRRTHFQCDSQAAKADASAVWSMRLVTRSIRMRVRTIWNVESRQRWKAPLACRLRIRRTACLSIDEELRRSAAQDLQARRQLPSLRCWLLIFLCLL